MTYIQAMREYGDYRKLAGLLNLPATTVHSWRLRGIPVARQYQIQVLSDGRLIATKNKARK
jgi:hypothetical protein